jgi:hypothetical protein
VKGLHLNHIVVEDILQFCLHVLSVHQRLLVLLNKLLVLVNQVLSGHLGHELRNVRGRAQFHVLPHPDRLCMQVESIEHVRQVNLIRSLSAVVPGSRVVSMPTYPLLGALNDIVALA